MLCPTNSTSQLTTQEHRRFLSLLAKDDAFRAELTTNPLAVLAEHGIHLDPVDLPAAVQLPGKDLLSLALDDEQDGQNNIHWAGLLG